MDQQNNKLGLVLISGPPGTGKSTFCNQLKSYLIDVKRQSTISISFDKIINKKLEDCMINAASSEWKTGRSIVFTLVALLIEYLNQLSVLKEEDFISLKQYFNSKLDKELVSSVYFKLILENFYECLKEDHSKFKANDCSFIILLDDIFYYESMRLMYFRLASNHNCSYFNYCIRPVDLDFLIHRNKTRDPEQKLNTSIIENIFSKFEYPNKMRWEQEFCHVQMEQEPSMSIDDKLNVVISGFQRFTEYLLVTEEEKAVLQQSRAKGQIKSLVHEADLLLRKLISSSLSGTETNKAQLARQLNTNKNNILNGLRQLDKGDNCEFYFKLNSLLLSSEGNEFEDELKRKLLIN